MKKLTEMIDQEFSEYFFFSIPWIYLPRQSTTSYHLDFKHFMAPTMSSRGQNSTAKSSTIARIIIPAHAKPESNIRQRIPNTIANMKNSIIVAIADIMVLLSSHYFS